MELLVSWTIIILTILLALIFNGFCLQYVINYWLSFFQKRKISIPLFVTTIGSIFLPFAPLALAVITWMISFGIENPYYR